MLWAAGIGRAAYDPETISMLTTVLERALAALPRQDRTEERKTRWHQASSGQPPGGSETPYCFTPRHWAAALGSLPLGRVLLPSPLGPSTVKRPESRSRVEVGAASAASRPGG